MCPLAYIFLLLMCPPGLARRQAGSCLPCTAYIHDGKGQVKDQAEQDSQGDHLGDVVWPRAEQIQQAGGGQFSCSVEVIAADTEVNPGDKRQVGHHE